MPLLEGGTFSNFAQWIPGRIVSESLDPFHMTSVAYFERWGREPAERILGAFDGGVIHIHGNGRHLLEAAATLEGLKAILLMDDRGFPAAFDVLADLKARVGDVPVAVFADYAKFVERLHRHELPGGVMYQVQERARRRHRQPADGEGAGVPGVRIAAESRESGQGRRSQRNPMHLHAVDWVIVVLSLLICFVPALFFGKRAGKGTAEFFASGRSVPWWLAGLSMVATTFSSDTPNLVTDIVRRQGVAGNWCWWAFVLTGVATVFFYARAVAAVRRDDRPGVLRDPLLGQGGQRGPRLPRRLPGLLLQLHHHGQREPRGLQDRQHPVRPGPLADAAVRRPAERRLRRPFRPVGRAGDRHDPVLHQDVGRDRRRLFRREAAAGRRPARAWSTSSRTISGPGGINYLNILPDFSNHWDIAVAVFIMPIAVQWWAVWYPGAEPGGGSYIAQRMLASKSEKDSLGGVLFFNVAHYCLRPWPWIIVALCSLIVYPQLSDIQKAFPNLDPRLLGHDIAYPAMLEVPARRLDRPDGGRPDRRQLLDDPHAPELGRLVPGPRFLPPLHHAGRRREALRRSPAGWPPSACSSARPG